MMKKKKDNVKYSIYTEEYEWDVLGTSELIWLLYRFVHKHNISVDEVKIEQGLSKIKADWARDTVKELKPGITNVHDFCTELTKLSVPENLHPVIPKTWEQERKERRERKLASWVRYNSCFQQYYDKRKGV